MRKEVKEFLDDFAQRNQYNNWKSVIKDKQSISLDAKDFQEVIEDVFMLKDILTKKSPSKSEDVSPTSEEETGR